MFNYCVILMTITLIECRGPHHPRGEVIVKHHQHYRPTRDVNQKLIQDEELLHDKEHIQEHLEEEIGEPDLSNLTDDELEFYYFQVHDTDKNSKLDGLEILQAIYHTIHHDHQDEEAEDNNNKQDNLDDFDYYVELIDKVLEEDDQNNDGYLSYTEYVKGRKKNESGDSKEPIVKMIT